jgi:uncharacterized repeat protein (TIGR03803 family)
VLVIVGAHFVAAQTVTTVLNFNGKNGSSPFMGTFTQGRDGKLYGTTYSGGANSLGTVFRIGNLTTGTVVVLHSFAGSDGSNPGAMLTLGTDDNFYGTTTTGGTANFGVLYKISGGGTYTILHDFAGGTDGSAPYGPPIEGADGNFYGTTSGTGVNAATIYKYTRSSGAYSVIYTFNAATTGSSVYGLIQGSDNLLYVTANGGGAKGCGTLVRISTSGVARGIHTFDCKGGGPANPIAPLIQASDGNYYGTSQGGGSAQQGTLFQVTPAFKVNVIYSFGVKGQTAKGPEAGLVEGTDGNLYGSVPPSQNPDVLFSSTFSGSYSTLYTFASGDTTDAGLLQHTSGVFYGLSQTGGTHSDGFVYSLDMKLGAFVALVRANGGVGSQAQILGQGLTGASGVTFNGTPATSFSVVSDTYMTAIVPTGATTGPVVVTTPGGTLTSNQSFRVIP